MYSAKKQNVSFNQFDGVGSENDPCFSWLATIFAVLKTCSFFEKKKINLQSWLIAKFN